MKPTDLVHSVGEWLSGTGEMSEIVISSRARLARNLADSRFVTRLGARARSDAEKTIRAAMTASGVAAEEDYVELNEITPLERRLLVERHLISKEHASGEGPRGVAIGEGERTSIMVLEEDHLRIQAMLSGFRLKEAWKLADGIDDALEKRLNYAFSPEFGYLTACPTNVGTGLRVSVMLHLPALVMTKAIEKVFHAMNKIGLAVRGLYGENTEASGHFYQISNQVTLGKSEADIVETIAKVVPQVVRYEATERETLLKEERRTLEDRIWRAYGMLRHARVLTSEEAMTLLSVLRMGLRMELMDAADLSALNELFITSQPAHIQILTGRELDPRERDVARADLVRARLDGN